MVGCYEGWSVQTLLAFAQEVLLTATSNTFTNTCPGGTGCADWGFTVSTEEPSSAEPVVVIWSARYLANKADVLVNAKGTFLNASVHVHDGIKEAVQDILKPSNAAQ
jgi:hypothetical protein